VANAVVEALDVVEYLRPGLLPGREVFQVDQLGPELIPEALRRGVVIALTSAARAHLDAAGRQQPCTIHFPQICRCGEYLISSPVGPVHSRGIGSPTAESPRGRKSTVATDSICLFRRRPQIRLRNP
jgi:hypothetical protein